MDSRGGAALQKYKFHIRCRAGAPRLEAQSNRWKPEPLSPRERFFASMFELVLIPRTVLRLG